MLVCSAPVRALLCFGWLATWMSAMSLARFAGLAPWRSSMALARLLLRWTPRYLLGATLKKGRGRSCSLAATCTSKEWNCIDILSRILNFRWGLPGEFFVAFGRQQNEGAEWNSSFCSENGLISSTDGQHIVSRNLACAKRTYASLERSSCCEELNKPKKFAAHGQGLRRGPLKALGHSADVSRS